MRHSISPRLLLPGFAAILFFAGGCSGGVGTEYVGTWVGHRAVQGQIGMSQELLNTASLVKLTIKPDGTFSLLDSGMPKTGTVSSESGFASLDVEMILNQPIERQAPDVQANSQNLTVTPMKDGGLLFKEPGSPDPNGLELQRDTGSSPDSLPAG